VVDCAHKNQHIPITQTQIYADTGDQYSATINAREWPSRIRTCLICTTDCHDYRRERDDLFHCEAHPLQKKLAIHMLDGVKAETRTTCGLPRCPSADQGPVYGV